MSKEPTKVGNITYDFDITCPHCGETMYYSLDRAWFHKTCGPSFPTDGVTGEYEATCPECDKDFIIDGFYP